jgi:hypothetical protein
MTFPQRSVRIIRNIYLPRISLEFRLTDGSGNVVQSTGPSK